MMEVLPIFSSSAWAKSLASTRNIQKNNKS